MKQFSHGAHREVTEKSISRKGAKMQSSPRSKSLEVIEFVFIPRIILTSFAYLFANFANFASLREMPSPFSVTSVCSVRDLPF